MFLNSRGQIKGVDKLKFKSRQPPFRPLLPLTSSLLSPPLYQLGWSGERCELPPVGSGAKPQPLYDLVHI